MIRSFKSEKKMQNKYFFTLITATVHKSLPQVLKAAGSIPSVLFV
jgi:hypothetical protein